MFSSPVKLLWGEIPNIVSFDEFFVHIVKDCRVTTPASGRNQTILGLRPTSLNARAIQPCNYFALVIGVLLSGSTPTRSERYGPWLFLCIYLRKDRLVGWVGVPS
jgi:hypothetical protein